MKNASCHGRVVLCIYLNYGTSSHWIEAHVQPRAKSGAMKAFTYGV